MRLTVRIRKHERGLRFRRGDFAGVVGPGAYGPFRRALGAGRGRIEIVSLLDTKLEHPLLEVLIRDESLRDLVEVVDLAAGQRALVWVERRLAYVLDEGLHAFWREPRRVEVEVFDLAEPRFTHASMQAVLEHPDAARRLEEVDVEPHAAVLFYFNGELRERLGPGKHVFWKGAGRLRFRVLDLRERVADIAGQEILTADKVTLRINLVVTYRVADAQVAVENSADFEQALYREAQLALRAAVGGRTLDALLADKEAVGAEVREIVRARAREFGLDVRSVGLRDLILPGDMKVILNRVIEAEKTAQADLIRRREETAAARSQANTARLLAESPALVRLKELELLREALAGTKTTFVLGRGDILEQVRSLTAQGEGAE